jgi:phosphoribosylamine--glycine ligase
LGQEVTPPADRAGVMVFHAGTSADSGGRLRAAGGRVLAITAVADTLAQAQQLSRTQAGAVLMDGKQFRSDIGWREMRRNARTS